MHDYMSVLALLHASAAEQRSRALLGKQAEIANKTTERALRNRALAICHLCKAWRNRNDPDTSTGLCAACNPSSRHG